MAVGDKVYIADKPTLDTVKTNTDDIKTKIGATNDAQSSSTSTGSIFAKLNYLVSQISNKLGPVYDWVSSLLSTIGSKSDAASNSTSSSLNAKINWILQRFGSYWTDARAGKLDNLDTAISSRASSAELGAFLSRGCIKSIQRGVAFFPAEPKNPVPMELEISPIDVEKSIVILNGCASRGYGDSAANAYPYVMSFASNLLTIGVSGSAYYLGAQYTWDWQVVEFY